jgi:hypothetical protein
MRGESGSLEGLLAGAGVTVAAAVLMVVVLTIFHSTGPANSAIMLQNVASDVCGDIGTAAISSLPYAHIDIYTSEGITVRITSDYVLAGDASGHEFARPLPVRVFPGSYGSQDMIFWNDTGELREYLNRTVGSTGTEEQPFNSTGGSQAVALMEKARRDLAINPLYINTARPLTVEKLFLYTGNDSSHAKESEPYVFVYQR